MADGAVSMTFTLADTFVLVDGVPGGSLARGGTGAPAAGLGGTDQDGSNGIPARGVGGRSEHGTAGTVT